MTVFIIRQTIISTNIFIVMSVMQIDFAMYWIVLATQIN